MSAAARSGAPAGFYRAHHICLILLWAQLPILAALGVWGGHPLPEVALGVAVPTAFALAGTALNSPRGASAAVAGGLIATSVLVVGHSGGSDLSHVHFLLMICAISLYRDRVMLIGSVLVVSTYLLVVPPQGSDPTLWVGMAAAFALVMALSWRVQLSASVAQPGPSHLYRASFHAAPIGMAVLRPSGEILEVNPALVDVLGRDQASLIGANVASLLHPDDLAELGAAWETMGNSDHHRATEWMRWVTAGGHPIWGRVSLSLVPRTPTGPAMVVLQIEDVTSTLEEQRRLESLVRGKDEFVATLGSELKDSLEVLIDLTDTSDRPHVDVAGTLPRIEAQVRDIASIIDDLIVSARADNAPVSVVPSRIDAGAICREVLAGLPDAENVSIEIGADEVWADAGLTRHVLASLIGNAIRYGGDTLSVRTVSSGPDTVFQVFDDGPEIPVSERERIFTGDLRSGQPVTQPAAVGLGLTVGRHLARLMDGDIEYRRIDGQNVFELRLPTEQISSLPRRVPAA
jgi:PAS domain S-box-containing protein